MVNKRMFNVVSFSFVLLCAIAQGLPAQEKNVENHCWTQIQIEEAFVSKETSRQYRDTFSAAEFGWHLRLGKKTIFKGNLYDTLYAPNCDLKDIKLQFVERDAFVDDLISRVALKKDVNNYLFSLHKDRVRLSYKDIFPDRNSGKNKLKSGATLLNDQLKDTVDFIKGDYTDYIKANKSTHLVMFISPFPRAKLTVLSKNHVVYPSSHQALKRFRLIEGKNLLLQIRGNVGRGQSAYTVKAFKKKALLVSLHSYSLIQSRQLKHNNDFVELASLLISYNQPFFQRSCKKTLLIKKDVGSRVLCSVVLYRIADPKDLDFLHKIYEKESLEYQKILRHVYNRTHKNKKKGIAK